AGRARPLLVMANLFRRPPCGDDLVCRAASQLRHMVGFEDKRCEARRGRADLDDQVTDLRLRHLRAHRIPAVPAVACIEAQDLATPAGRELVAFVDTPPHYT